MQEQTTLNSGKEREFKQSARLMGNHFEITVVGDDGQWAGDCIAAAISEIKRIERLLTTFSEHSQTHAINAMAGIRPVAVDAEMFDLIRRAQRISGITDGAFDITYGSLDKSLWNFDQSMTRLPDPETAQNMVRLINYRNILLDEEAGTVMLKEQGMRIGFGGIGKGYAADMAKKCLAERGVKHGIVNASGDLTAWGKDANGKTWMIGIGNPDDAGRAFSYLPIDNMAIATSGNYEKFVIIDGRKYSHTINPRTGLPVTGIKSVTVLAPHAELADAMTTPVMIMGIRAGLGMINQIKGLGCIIIDDDNKIYSSNNIHLQ